MSNRSKSKETYLSLMIFLSACLLLIPCKAVTAEDSLPVPIEEEAFNNCFDSGLPYDYFISGTDKERAYAEFWYKTDKSDRYNSSYALIKVWYFADPIYAEAEYIRTQKNHGTTLSWVAEEENMRLIYSNMGDVESSVVYAGPTSIGGIYALLQGNYIVTMGVYSSGRDFWWDDETYMDYFNDGLECIKAGISDARYVLKMSSHHPFSEEVPAAYSGGDLVAKVLDKKDNSPIANKLVYFFRSSQDQDYFRLPNSSDKFGSDHKANNLSDDYLFDKTNAAGDGKFNYISNGCLDYHLLGKTLGKDGSVKIPITAVVFDRDPLTTSGEAKIVGSASYEIVLNSIARIKKVGTLDEREKPQGEVIVRRSGTDTSVKTPMLLNVDSATGYRGYGLRYGDKIIISKYDEVFVQWLSGTSMIFRPNTYYFDTEGWTHAEAEIGSSDAGMGSWLDGVVNNVYLQGAVSLTGLSIAVYGQTAAAAGAWVSPAGLFLAIPGVTAYLWNGTRGYLSPILLEHKSQILMDYDDDEVSVYTAEGTAILHNTDSWDTVDVTTGHKMAISSEGAFDAVVEFKESELDDDLSDMLQAVRQDEPDENCMVISLLGRNDPGLKTIRDFRDKVLAKSNTGEKIISLFYENNHAMAAYIDKSPIVRKFLKNLTTTFMPVLACFL